MELWPRETPSNQRQYSQQSIKMFVFISKQIKYVKRTIKLEETMEIIKPKFFSKGVCVPLTKAHTWLQSQLNSWLLH